MGKDIKNTLIQATIDLIRDTDRDISQIKIQDICARADVAMGLVNYHFGTKENLLSICIQKIVESSFEYVTELYEPAENRSPLDDLREFTKLVFDYLEDTEQISRTTYLPGFVNFYLQDNMKHAVKTYYPFIKNIYPHWSEAKIREKAYLYNIMLEGLFIRAGGASEYLTLDYHKTSERNQLLDYIINCLFL